MQLTVTKEVRILPQPTDESCGPTCLQAVYNYYEDTIGLDELIGSVKSVDGGGTLAVMLGNHALKRGYQASIYTYNLQVFDPTWFQKPTDVTSKLREQRRHKKNPKMNLAIEEYLQFLELGGVLKFEELTANLLRKILKKETPILTGLSATYLYQSARELPDTNQYDDVKGHPTGHFVVICGYDEKERKVLIADPLKPNPISETEQYYHVPIQRLLNSVLLGIVTYDANLLIIQPK